MASQHYNNTLFKNGGSKPRVLHFQLLVLRVRERNGMQGISRSQMVTPIMEHIHLIVMDNFSLVQEDQDLDYYSFVQHKRDIDESGDHHL